MKNSIQYYCLSLSLLVIGIQCQILIDSDDHEEEDGFIKHFFNSDNPDEFQKPPIPLRMGIWMGLVLGIFVLMAVGVCCGLFCKYSGKLASTEVTTPIPIVVTPPSRTPTVGSFIEEGYFNQGYSGSGLNEAQCCASASATPPDSPTRDVLPMYTDLARSNEMNASFERIVKGTLETPPPFYITVPPFK